MPKNVVPYVLTINRFKLDVFLGVTDNERAKTQPVYVDIHIYYPEMPESMKQDGTQYDCYDVITNRLVLYCSTRQFHLLEFLTARLFDELRHEIKSSESIWLKVTKTSMHLNPSFMGGVSFVMSDLAPELYHVPVSQ